MLFESETFRGISDVSDILVKILDSLPGANSTSEQIKEFESLVKVELQTDQVPPELPPILRKFGWNGVRFTAQDEGEKIRFDIDSLRAELSGAYMRSITNPAPFQSVPGSPTGTSAGTTRRMPGTVTKKLVGFSESELADDLVIQSYCPNILFELFPKVKEPTSVTFFAACVLVDISGFTKLSSGFCQNGSQGLDDLHNTTSSFLGIFSDTIYEYGGDVIAFAGDALICIFKANEEAGVAGSEREGSLPSFKTDACLRALQCAFKLKDLHTEQLKCHAGVSCGDMSFGVLGGYKNKWTYLLNGSCIPELSTCLDDSKARQVAVSAPFYAAVETFLDLDSTVVEHNMNTNNRKILEMKLNYPVSTSEPRFQDLVGTNLRERTAVAKVFVAAPVVEAIFTGQFSSSMSELRDVTTVFINLDSYDHYTHSDPSTLQPFVIAVQTHLDKTGGFLRQFLIDDKGCVLIAMWGVPSFSYGNNEARALQFSHDLSGELSKLFHHCSIGITTGSVFCGNVGTSSRHDYVGIGHPVNLSARLMCKAQGRILLDETTFARLPIQYQTKVREAEVLQLKGVEVPMQSYAWRGKFGDYGGDDHDEDKFPCLQDLNKMSTYEGGGGYTRRIGSHRESLATINDEPGEVDSGLAKEILDRVNLQLDTLDDLDRMSTLEDFQLQLKYTSDDGGNSSVAASTYSSTTPLPTYGQKMPSTIMSSNILDYLSTQKGHSLSNVTCTLLEGAGGTGKSKAAKYFITAARNRCNRCVWIAGRLSDMTAPYGIFKKIIIQLVGAENFSSDSQQKLLFKKMLLTVYSNITYTSAMLKEHLLLLNSALGLKWRRIGHNDINVSFVGLAQAADTYAGGPRSFGGGGGGSSGLSPNTGTFAGNYLENSEGGVPYGEEDVADTVVDYSIKNRDTVMLHKSMFANKLISSVISVILIQKPSVIVIENVQFADELSWKQIHAIMDLPVCVAMLLTVRTVGTVNDVNAGGIMPTATENEEDNSISFRSVKSKTSIMGFHSNTANSNKVVPVISPGSTSLGSPVMDRARGQAFSSTSNQRRFESMHVVRHDAYERVLRHPQVVKLVTVGLTREDVEMFLLFTLDKDEIPGFIVDIVFELSNGNWYYINKLTRFIFQRGTDEFIREMSSEHANHTLGLLAIFGFDSLKPQEKALMKTASVIGEEFYKDMLEALIPSALLPFIDQLLDSLISNGLLICEDYDPPCYAFPSSQICSSLYDLIPRSEALQYHHKLSLYIENTYMDSLSQHYETLSYHTAFSPERMSTAFKYDCLAADQQISIGGYGKALYLIKIALTHSKSVAEMMMLRDIVVCASEDMFQLSNGALTATDDTPGRRFLTRMTSLFSPSAVASVLGGNSRGNSPLAQTKEEGADDEVGDVEVIEAPTVTGQLSDGWKRAYRRLLKIKTKLDSRIAAFKEAKSVSGIDMSLITPSTTLGWAPEYLEARTAEKDLLKNNQSSSMFSKYFNW